MELAEIPNAVALVRPGSAVRPPLPPGRRGPSLTRPAGQGSACALAQPGRSRRVQFLRLDGGANGDRGRRGSLPIHGRGHFHRRSGLAGRLVRGGAGPTGAPGSAAARYVLGVGPSSSIAWPNERPTWVSVSTWGRRSTRSPRVAPSSWPPSSTGPGTCWPTTRSTGRAEGWACSTSASSPVAGTRSSCLTSTRRDGRSDSPFPIRRWPRSGTAWSRSKWGWKRTRPSRTAVRRAEALLDCGFERWRERETWRRRSMLEGSTEPSICPGTTWHDRPGIDRGGGVFLCGDSVAAPGLLSEVAWASAITAGRAAATYLVADI